MIKDALQKFKGGPEMWGLRLSLVAAFCFMLMRSGATLTGYEQIIATLSLGMAALVFEYIAAKKATLGWISRSPVALVGWGLVWAAAFAYAGNNWLGAASDGEAAKSAVQKAVFATDSSNVDELKAAKAERDRISSRLSWMQTAVNGQPVRAPEAAQADLDNAKGQKLWQQTDQCRGERSNKREREFCDKVAGWKAELALAIEKATLQAEFASAKTAVAGYEARVVGKQQLAMSDKRTDLRFYIKYAGLSDEVAMDVQALLKIFVVSAFVTLSAVLATIEANKHLPRKPWINWRAIFTGIRRLWDGSKPSTIVVDRHIVAHTIRTADGGKRIVGQEVQAA